MAAGAAGADALAGVVAAALRSREPQERLRLPEPLVPLQSPSFGEPPRLQASPDSTD
jgi:hypothetical protein